MAPEVLNGPPSTASDMFSLGVTMLELATNVDVEAERSIIRQGCLPKSWFEGVSMTLREKFVRLLNAKARCRPTAGKLLKEIKPLSLERATFKCMREIITPFDKEYYMDKDWEYESEDVVYPPSLRAKRKYDKTFISPPLRKRLIFDEDDDGIAPSADADTTPQAPAQPFTRVLEFSGSPPLKKAKISVSAK
ncbi:unnamed protein product [Strongylus vulgaris]|uniref:Protein kinase domain-containing protein n=1 Tax=Strongylus vulgaris TaxID=40348 RepID=A0A3P7KT70_STRVU|nr:unnamed protein product [Strongylus vulgaris]